MDVEFENIKVDIAGQGARLTLNRPEKKNPLNWDTVRELRIAVEQLNQDENIMSVVIIGSGDSFSAGGDLEKYLQLFESPEDFRDFMEEFYNLFAAIEVSPAVYIAAINGVCAAGGLEVLLACDVVVAAESAKIGDAHLNFGQLPGAGSSIRLWRAIGTHNAKHLVFTGDFISARRAYEIGLVQEFAKDDEFEALIKTLEEKIDMKSPASVKGVKYLLNQAVREDLEKGLRTEIDYVHRYATTEADPMEGLIAFRDKRKPQFGKKKRPKP